MTDEPLTPLEAPPDLGELVAALAKAQGEFPTIEKKAEASVQGRDGRQGYSYKYADIGDVLAAVRPVLSKHQLAITQRTKPRDGRTILITELRHSSGQVLDTEIELGQSSGNPQQFGGALTYLRRYEIVTLLGIAAEEDRDAQDVDPAPRGNGNGSQPAWAKPATRARVGELGVALSPLMGRARAAAIATTIKANLGSVPDVAIATVKLVAAQQADALRATGMLEQHQRELQVQAEQAAKDAAEAQAATQAQEASGEPEPEPPAEGPPSGGEPERPAAGTVAPPELEVGESEKDLEQRYRDAGCICPGPLEPDDDMNAHDDACPIKGHGIPF